MLFHKWSSIYKLNSAILDQYGIQIQLVRHAVYNIIIRAAACDDGELASN